MFLPWLQGHQHSLPPEKARVQSLVIGSPISSQGQVQGLPCTATPSVPVSTWHAAGRQKDLCRIIIISCWVTPMQDLFFVKKENRTITGTILLQPLHVFWQYKNRIPRCITEKLKERFKPSLDTSLNFYFICIRGPQGYIVVTVPDPTFEHTSCGPEAA